MRKPLLLELHYHLKLKHVIIRRHTNPQLGIVNLCHGLISCILFFITIAFDYFPWGLLAAQSN
jgi:hypothetical protein